MRDIKRRRSSIESTQQITKAMKLVSTVKLQKARARAEDCAVYFHRMYETMQSILARTGSLNHPYLKENASGKKAVIVISANRGLAGGYNTNAAKKFLESGFAPEEVCLYTVGQKAKEYLTRRGYTVVQDASEMIEEPTYADAVQLSKTLLSSYASGEIGALYLVYTEFKNTVTQTPVMMQLLPVVYNKAAEDVQTRAPMTYVPNEEAVLEKIVPLYVQSLIYGGMIESVASENSARMQAMDNATENAEEMIEELALSYNRARQGAITQELTEIIAGAEAVG